MSKKHISIKIIDFKKYFNLPKGSKILGVAFNFPLFKKHRIIDKAISYCFLHHKNNCKCKDSRWGVGMEYATKKELNKAFGKGFKLKISRIQIPFIDRIKIVTTYK